MSSHDLVTLLAAIIGGEALVLGAAVPLMFSTRKHAREASTQVSNDHSTNLRVELDERHQDDLRWRTGLGKRLDGIDGRIDRLSDRVTSVDERTLPRITKPATPRRRKP